MTRKHRLLLVDDEPRNLALLDAILTPLGYETRSATDGRSALALLDRDDIDLVLLDVMMPDFDGLDVLAHVRANPKTSELPVILVTAHTDREHRVRGIQAGADDFLEKPVDAELLKARIRTLLRLNDSRGELVTSRDALHVKNNELEALRREQRELMEFLVHDLKNPLAVIAGNLDFLRSGAFFSSDAMEAVDDARDAAARLRMLVQDLLTVSRLEHSQLTIHPESIQVDDFLRIVLSTYARKAQERKVTLSMTATRGLKVRADTSLLQRVFENIVDNSFRFTPPSGRIAVDARGNGEVVIAISNSGPPIPKEHRASIFEKFARLGTSRGTAGNVGIGLYFCKRAVEAHDGFIDVTQTAEWPTSFVIRLPAA